MKILLHGASGRMGRAILSGVGVDVDSLPELGRIAMIEGESGDLLAAFDARSQELFKEKIANWPDGHESGWKSLQREAGPPDRSP